MRFGVDYGNSASGGGYAPIIDSKTVNTSTFVYQDVPAAPKSIVFFNNHNTYGVGVYEYNAEDGLANCKISRKDQGMRQPSDMSNFIDLSVSGKVGFKQTSSNVGTTVYYEIYC